MRLRTLLHNGASLSLLFSMASALFLSPRGCALCALCAPVSAISVLRFFPLSCAQACQLTCLHRLAASFPALCTFFCIRFLCFQSVAASFPKTPGWGYLSFLPTSAGNQEARGEHLIHDLTNRPVRLQNRVTMIHGAGQIRIRKGDAPKRRAAQNLAGRGLSIASKEKSRLRIQIRVSPAIQNDRGKMRPASNPACANIASN